MNAETPVESRDPDACCEECPARRIVNGRLGNAPVEHPSDILSDAIWAYNGVCELLSIAHDKPDMNCVDPNHLLTLLDLIRSKLKAAQAGFDAQS